MWFSHVLTCVIAILHVALTTPYRRGLVSSRGCLRTSLGWEGTSFLDISAIASLGCFCTAGVVSLVRCWFMPNRDICSACIPSGFHVSGHCFGLLFNGPHPVLICLALLDILPYICPRSACPVYDKNHKLLSVTYAIKKQGRNQKRYVKSGFGITNAPMWHWDDCYWTRL